jgi:hypothetical protein
MLTPHGQIELENWSLHDNQHMNEWPCAGTPPPQLLCVFRLHCTFNEVYKGYKEGIRTNCAAELCALHTQHNHQRKTDWLVKCALSTLDAGQQRMVVTELCPCLTTDCPEQCIVNACVY